MIDLRTDAGLKSACEEAEASQVNQLWRDSLLEFLKFVNTASVDERATPDFQRRLWVDNPVSGESRRSGKVDAAIADEGFRRWLAEQSFRELSEGLAARTVSLTKLYDDILEKLKPFCDRMPHLKVLRILAAFFPNDFTTLCDRGLLRKHLIQLFGKGTYAPVEGNLKIRARLEDVLGEVDRNDPKAVVARLTMPWMLYALAAESEKESTVDPAKPGEERLQPLPAARRRKGLTTLKDSFNGILSILAFVRDRPTREELMDFLRSENPTSKDSSLHITANVLRSEFGVIRLVDDHYVLTERGEAVLESEDPGDLRDWLLTRVLGIDHVLVALRDSPKTAAELDDLLQAVNPGWTSNRMPGAMRNWLRNLGVIAGEGPGPFGLTEAGRDWAELVFWQPESLPPEKGKDEELVEPPIAKVAVELPEHGAIVESVEKAGVFAPGLIESLHLGVWADDRRHFAILTGLSGSGKTLLARAYGRAIAGSDDSVCTIPVQPGWYDPTPLFGYVNPLTGATYESTPFLGLLLRAMANPTQPHVLVLDEMNLSHPEQYFAPVLSAMETGADLQLHSKGDYFDGTPERIPYPSNLIVIGTVNMDETTMGLSDKVLDRAFTLEFWDIDLAKWPGWGETGLEAGEEARVRDLLGALMIVLSPARLHFGWRVIGEIVGFLRGRDQAGTLSFDAALDRAIYAKVLPKLRGEDSRRFREALEGCGKVLDAGGLSLSRAKVGELLVDLDTLGSARFWR